MPFARYVLENAGKLQFPFRRYQIQKVWRGERPQEGRYREFLQADIDIVDRDTLPLALRGRDAAGHRRRARRRCRSRRSAIQVNNRKVCEGFYRGLGLADPDAALRAVDKLDKIGPDRVAALLVETAGATEAQAKACLALAEISAPDALVRRRGPRARRRATRCSTRAWPSWSTVVETAARARARPAASPT